MSAKDSQNAKAAQNGAMQQPATDAPASDEAAVLPCKKKHAFIVRVEFSDNTLVESGIQKKLQLNNGDARDVSLAAGAQNAGKYSTGIILDSTADCHISFPDVYDAECKLK